MNTQVLADKCEVEVAVIVNTHEGDINEWMPLGSYWCRRIPLDVSTRLSYQQKNTEATHRFVFGKDHVLRLGVHRIKMRGTVYELVESSLNLDGQVTVLTKEVLS